MSEVTFRSGDDVISEQDFRQYFDVIQSAFAVHLDREHIRRGLWKEYPAKAQVDQVRIKADRVLRSLEFIESNAGHANEMAENAVSELYDVINYSVFAIRQIMGQV